VYSTLTSLFDVERVSFRLKLIVIIY